MTGWDTFRMLITLACLFSPFLALPILAARNRLRGNLALTRVRWAVERTTARAHRSLGAPPTTNRDHT